VIEYIDYQNTVYTQTEAFSSASKVVSSYSETKSEDKDSSDSNISLGKFLNKVIPLFENAFEENRKSQAFEGYELIEVCLSI
jgi:hypothetical protein